MALILLRLKNLCLIVTTDTIITLQFRMFYKIMIIFEDNVGNYAKM